MISIDLIDDGLPISIIVPLSEKRKSFFYNYTLPLIEANEPKEIIINSNHGSAPKKRNDGFNKSTQPYVFFCDDDILLPANLLSKLFEIISNRKEISFVYTGYDGIVMNPHKHPMKGNYKIKSEDFNVENLKKYNYISTMTLIKRDCFIGFDENLKRFQDWDLFLSLTKNGYKGLFYKDLTFMAFYLDDSITTNNENIKSSLDYLKKKHNKFIKW